jgi:ribonucleoside-diphosphate reductase alpha chain
MKDMKENTMEGIAERKQTGSKQKGEAAAAGLRFSRYFSKEGKHPFDEIKWTKRKSAISNTDGSIVSGMDSVEVPEEWSQLATDIAVSKFFRKAGVAKKAGDSDSETSARQLVTRIASAIRKAGERLEGYFKTPKDAEIFEAELTSLLITQRGAFNSPVWFNCGLFEAYGIEGSGGNYHWNPKTNRIEATENAYQSPQCSACFIQSVDDDLMSIFDLIKNEARLFKYGSGTTTQFLLFASQL